MKTSKIYFYLAISSIFLTFLTGLGFVLSIILLFLISSEKQNLLSNFDESFIQRELQDLKNAKVLSIANLILTALLLFIVFIGLLFFGFWMVGIIN